MSVILFLAEVMKNDRLGMGTLRTMKTEYINPTFEDNILSKQLAPQRKLSQKAQHMFWTQQMFLCRFLKTET